jgi:hypothetical protein
MGRQKQSPIVSLHGVAIEKMSAKMAYRSYCREGVFAKSATETAAQFRHAAHPWTTMIIFSNDGVEIARLSDVLFC